MQKVLAISCIDFTVISNHLRLDRGSETGDMATIHSFLIQNALATTEGGEDMVHYGPSTKNKVLQTQKRGLSLNKPLVFDRN